VKYNKTFNNCIDAFNKSVPKPHQKDIFSNRYFWFYVKATRLQISNVLLHAEVKNNIVFFAPKLLTLKSLLLQMIQDYIVNVGRGQKTGVSNWISSFFKLCSFMWAPKFDKIAFFPASFWKFLRAELTNQILILEMLIENF